MESLPELDVFSERDRQYIPTGKWCWEVFNASSQGPIQGGIEISKEMANIVGSNVRNMTEVSLYN